MSFFAYMKISVPYSTSFDTSLTGIWNLLLIMWIWIILNSNLFTFALLPNSCKLSHRRRCVFRFWRGWRTNLGGHRVPNNRALTTKIGNKLFHEYVISHFFALQRTIWSHNEVWGLFYCSLCVIYSVKTTRYSVFFRMERDPFKWLTGTPKSLSPSPT